MSCSFEDVSEASSEEASKKTYRMDLGIGAVVCHHRIGHIYIYIYIYIYIFTYIYIYIYIYISCDIRASLLDGILVTLSIEIVPQKDLHFIDEGINLHIFIYTYIHIITK